MKILGAETCHTEWNEWLMQRHVWEHISSHWDGQETVIWNRIQEKKRLGDELS